MFGGVHLIFPDEAVGLQRLLPAQTDLLLVAAAQDGVYRNSPGNCRDGNI